MRSRASILPFSRWRWTVRSGAGCSASFRRRSRSSRRSFIECVAMQRGYLAARTMAPISGFRPDRRATLLAVRALQRVGVFCGSSIGTQSSVHALAHDLGATLAQQGIGLVYGGAKVGVMGMIADAVLEADGEVIGVLPDGLFSREVPHENLTQLHLVDNMHDRKELIYELSDGFVVLPGGLGTLDELFEAATWNQLRLQEPLEPITMLAHAAITWYLI